MILYALLWLVSDLVINTLDLVGTELLHESRLAERLNKICLHEISTSMWNMVIMNIYDSVTGIYCPCRNILFQNIMYRESRDNAQKTKISYIFL